MSNEIAHGADSTKQFDAYVSLLSNKYIYDVGDDSLEPVGTWNDARADECNIAMAATGNVHYADFPSSLGAGIYHVLVKERAGANAVIADHERGQGIMYWDGSAEINPFTLDANVGIVIPAGYIGDYREEDTVYLFWRTNVALGTAGTIIVYKDDNTGEATAPTGITDTRNYDSKTGIHLVTIDLSASIFYTRETDYIVALSGAASGSKTINTVVGSFSVENRYQGLKFSKHDG